MNIGHAVHGRSMSILQAREFVTPMVDLIEVIVTKERTREEKVCLN